MNGTLIEKILMSRTRILHYLWMKGVPTHPRSKASLLKVLISVKEGNVEDQSATRSISIANPWPAPNHIESTAYLP